MSTVRELIEGNAPETYAEFVKVYDGTTNSKPDVVRQRMDVVLSMVIVDGIDVEAQNEFVKSYLADLVTLDLIPTWIDYWQVQSRRSDSVASQAGFKGLGGEQSTNYDRVDGLQKLAAHISRRLNENRGTFLSVADAIIRKKIGTATDSIVVSSTPDELLTANPQDFETLSLEPGYAGLGVVYIERP